ARDLETGAGVIGIAWQVSSREGHIMGSISRRGFLGATAGASAATAMGMAGIRPAHAAFPERGLLIIVPYAAGGGSDISARLLAKDLEPIFGKPVTVENRAGGGGWIGWGSLAQSNPDGY